MYGDELTPAMEYAIKETNRRRKIQDDYNKANGIIPKTIKKEIRDTIEVTKLAEEEVEYKIDEVPIEQLRREMKKAAKELDFERAALLRDEIVKRGG